MYQEVLMFEKDMPFMVKIQDIRRYPIHWHDNAVEVLLPLNGSVEVVSNFERTTVREGEFYFSNNKAVHSLRSATGTLTAAFYFDLDYFERQYPYIKYMFFRSSVYQENPGEKAAAHFGKASSSEKASIPGDQTLPGNSIRFRNLLTGILSDMAKGMSSADVILQKYESRLMHSMVHDFNWLRFLKEDSHFMSPTGMDRYHRIVKYVQENYSRKITLDDIVEREFITKTYLSHFWKDFSSYSFRERINFERAIKSEAMLLSGMPITTISERCGFSDVKYYYQNFRRWYGCMPTEHRRRCEAYAKLGPDYQNEAIESISAILPAYMDKYFIIQCLDSDNTELTSLYDDLLKRREPGASGARLMPEPPGSILADLFQTNNFHFEGPAIVFNWNSIDLWVDLSLELGSALHIKLMPAGSDKAVFIKAIGQFLEYSLHRYGLHTVQDWQFIIKFSDSALFDPSSTLEQLVREYLPNAIINYSVENI